MRNTKQRTKFTACLLIWGALTAFAASAEVNLNVNINVGPAIVLPVNPAVVLATPGIFVISDSPDEVFFVSGFYWTLHGGHWYQCDGHKGKWVKVKKGKIPPGLLKLPPGKFKNWRPSQKNDSKSAKDGKGHGKHK